MPQHDQESQAVFYAGPALDDIQLCAEIGWRTGGGKRLMTLATLLEAPKFLEFFNEILDDAAAQFEKAEGNAN